MTEYKVSINRNDNWESVALFSNIFSIKDIIASCYTLVSGLNFPIQDIKIIDLDTNNIVWSYKVHGWLD